MKQLNLALQLLINDLVKIHINISFPYLRKMNNESR